MLREISGAMWGRSPGQGEACKEHSMPQLRNVSVVDFRWTRAEPRRPKEDDLGLNTLASN